MLNINKNFGNKKTPISVQDLVAFLKQSKNIYADYKKLSLFSFAAGLAVIAFLGARLFLGVILRMSKPLSNLIFTSEIFNFSLLSLFSAVSIGLPFLVVYKVTKGLADRDILPLGKPKNSLDMVLLVFVGFAGCIAAGLISSYFVLYVQELFKVDFAYSIDPPPKSALGLFFYFLSFSVMPAIFEEFALRGVVMQPLRKYGDGFALLMSALVFALMHGNMIQLPFALLAGLAIGFVVIKTETLWTGMIVHFLNNASSVLQSILMENLKKSGTAALIIYSFYALVLGLGLLSLLLYLKREKERNKIQAFDPYRPYIKQKPLLYKNPLFPLKKTAGKYIFTAPMLAAILIMVIQTISTITSNG